MLSETEATIRLVIALLLGGLSGSNANSVPSQLDSGRICSSLRERLSSWWGRCS